MLKLEPWIVLNSDKNPKNCILCLPGRGSHAGELVRWYNNELQMDDNLIVGITPELRCWYPLPNGPDDQTDAVEGILKAKYTIERVIRKIGIPRKNMFLVGHSAGAVMAIQLSIHSPEPFAGVIVHSGAILEPKEVPECQNDTPYLLIHSKDDVIFKWDERYLPMRDALEERGYDIQTYERDDGDHYMHPIQLLYARAFINKVLNES